jgi:hypothetical protein
MFESLEADVLVIGGGGAALRAAIQAAENNPKLPEIRDTLSKYNPEIIDNNDRFKDNIEIVKKNFLKNQTNKSGNSYKWRIY